MEPDLLFAYGPDLLPEVLTERGGSPKVIGNGYLAGYRLAFFGYSARWDSGLETVVPATGSQVWGVLYHMGRLDWEALDETMGARFDGTGPYFHFPVEIVQNNGRIASARLYMKDLQGEPKEPSQEYLQLLLRGAEHQKLPTVYRDELRNIHTHPASFEVPAHPRKALHVFSASDCNQCSSPEDR